MKKVWIIFAQELRILSKDRQAVALLFVMPLALIVFLTLALQDVYQNKVGAQRKLTIVTREPCAPSTEKNGDTNTCAVLVAKLQSFGYKTILTTGLNSSGSTDLALILPNRVQETLDRLEDRAELLPQHQLQLMFNPLIDQASRALVEGHLMLSLQAILIERMDAAMNDAGASLEDSWDATPKRVTDVSSFQNLLVQKAFGNVVLPNPIQQTVPAWTLFGMFFIVIPLTNSMIRDRRLGIFKRLLSFPITKWHLILGKVLPFVFINIVQFLIMFSVGFILLPRVTGLQLPLDFSIAGVLLVTIASALAATAYALLISCFAKSSEQAHAFGAFSVVILAIIGGVMIPRFVMPEFMQTISVVSPLQWGLDAYLDLIVKKRDVIAVLPKVFLLLGFATIAAIISGLRFRWTEED
ncbi:MAG: ABC transporter permease [Proteobacteria bacterium]|nr:MAG: ABC transporter permease [Pseudomonadota bacterium]